MADLVTIRRTLFGCANKGSFDLKEGEWDMDCSRG